VTKQKYEVDVTVENKNLYLVIRPIIEEKLKEYEKNHSLKSEEERATVRMILTSMFFSNRVRIQEAKFRTLQFTQLN
jgi:hypothetical protein